VNGVVAGMVAAFGAVIGSFLNVVIHRLPRGEPMGMVRSRCPRCGRTIRWHDNVPVLSYLLLLGRCRDCKAPISPRYPLVEALTAFLFALSYLRAVRLGWEPLWLALPVAAAFAAVLVAATFIDFAHKLLPDRLTLRAMPVIGLVGAVGVPSIHGTSLFGHDLALHVKPGLASLVVGLAGAATGFAVIFGIRQVGTWIARREAMGLGDVKFMLSAGLLLGPSGTLLAIGVAMVAALLGIVIWLVTRDREIPFGPFLAVGSLAVLLHGDAVRHFVFEVWPAFVRGE
jgi:leader peptidase (prepilin peptidase)/N-methyltransferase